MKNPKYIQIMRVGPPWGLKFYIEINKKNSFEIYKTTICSIDMQAFLYRVDSTSTQIFTPGGGGGGSRNLKKKNLFKNNTGTIYTSIQMHAIIELLLSFQLNCSMHQIS